MNYSKSLLIHYLKYTDNKIILAFFYSGDIIKEQLEWQCTQSIFEPVPCGNNSSFCFFPEFQACNGVANCPQGEDEALDLCVDRGTFSEEATFTCEKRDVYNVTIWINAIPCNGIGDCIWDKDELDCSLPNFILIVILAISITICGVFGFFLWQGITFVLPRKKNIHDWPDFDSLHESDVLKETMFHAQTLENYQDFNSKMVEMEMKMHDKNISEVVCCIKVKFSYATLILFLTKFLSYFCHRIFKTHQQQENL